MHEFLSTWYGLTLFIVFDVVALIVVLAIFYRVPFKRFFDILFSALCLAVCSPAFLWVYAKYRTYKKEGGEVDGFLRRTPAVGKKGETIFLTTFQTLDLSGNVAGEYGKGMQERSLRNLPRLLDVFWGRASFIGVSALTFEDAAFLDDEQELRYEARVGLISPVKKEEKSSPQTILAAEAKYAHSYTLLTDLKLAWGWLLSKIRGEKEERTALGYAKYLLNNGDVSKEEYDSVVESALEEEKEWHEKQKN
ncbi:MAG: sugar transferase [Clostridia bacterium]|nr:sugar transferase [Clostridia bacterium]